MNWRWVEGVRGVLEGCSLCGYDINVHMNAPVSHLFVHWGYWHIVN